MTERLTDADIAELRRLRSAGTQGEWRACGGFSAEYQGIFADRAGQYIVFKMAHDKQMEAGEPIRVPSDYQQHCNQKLITAAVNSLPRLLDEVAALRAEVRNLQGQVERDETELQRAEEIRRNYETRKALRLRYNHRRVLCKLHHAGTDGTILDTDDSAWASLLIERGLAEVRNGTYLATDAGHEWYRKTFKVFEGKDTANAD